VVVVVEKKVLSQREGNDEKMKRSKIEEGMKKKRKV